MNKQYNFAYTVHEDDKALETKDKELLDKARAETKSAYAPYSQFFVGAVGLLSSGETISGTNQENASYPVGICAERVLLSAASVLHKDVPIETIAISYANNRGESDKPITPCGICRQSLAEYEERTKQPIRLILAGLNGPVMIIESAGSLLPFSFAGTDMS